MIDSAARFEDLPGASAPRPAWRAGEFSLGLIIVACALVLLLVASSARSQTGNRDHLTLQESDIVRDTQELDKRIDVFIKAVGRRFAIMNGAPDPALKAAPKKKKQDDEVVDWGDSPKGSRAELVGDIAGILDEAITNIDDVSRRDEKNPLIGKSMRRLAAAAKGFLTQLAPLRPLAKDADELAVIERAIDNAQQIVDASAKAPPPPDSDKQKKKP